MPLPVGRPESTSTPALSHAIDSKCGKRHILRTRSKAAQRIDGGGTSGKGGRMFLAGEALSLNPLPSLPSLDQQPNEGGCSASLVADLGAARNAVSCRHPPRALHCPAIGRGPSPAASVAWPRVRARVRMSRRAPRQPRRQSLRPISIPGGPIGRACGPFQSVGCGGQRQHIPS